MSYEILYSWSARKNKKGDFDLMSSETADRLAETYKKFGIWVTCVNVKNSSSCTGWGLAFLYEVHWEMIESYPAGQVPPVRVIQEVKFNENDVIILVRRRDTGSFRLLKFGDDAIELLIANENISSCTN